MKMIMALLVLVTFTGAQASTNKNKPVQYQDQTQEQLQISSQGQTQQTVVNIGGGGEGQGSLASLSSGATTLSDNSSVSFSTENNSSNTVLVPNNNTESCLRVFGLGFPTSQGSVILGIPWRSGQCDLEAAADDAFAQGQMAMGWMIKCKQKALKKAFGTEANCLTTALEGLNINAELDRLRKQNSELLTQRASNAQECDNALSRASERTNRAFLTCQEDK